MLKAVLLFNIFVETVLPVSLRIIKWIEKSLKEQNLLDI